MRRYPGLSPFLAEQKDLFFGRDTDIKDLSKLVFVERKVLLYSKSGYGKTSLLNAGVIPELQKNKDFEFIKIRFRAYTKGNETPNEIFLRSLKQHSDFTSKNQSIIDEFAEKYQTNFWLILKHNQLAGNNHKTYIFIFDQFEELFTYPMEQISEFKQNFAQIILTNRQPEFFNEIEDKLFEKNIDEKEIEKLYQSVNVKSIFSIRSDRLSELNNLADEITDIQKIFFELQPLTKEHAKKAILNPANKTGDFESLPFTYDSNSIEKIISELTNNGKQKIETTQLQIVCQRIEENNINKKQENIIMKTDDIPDFKDIFLNFYDSAISKVNSDNSEKVRKFIEDQLIIENRRISLDEFVCQRYIKNETLKTLVETRLLRVERNTVEGYSYELSHDTLVPPIKEIADKRRAKEENERLKVKQRKQIRIIILSILISVISIGAAIFGFWQKQQAQDALQKLNEEQKLREIETKKRDSINFQYYLHEGINQKENSKYSEAIQSLNFALKFDSTKQVIDLINDCKNKIGVTNQFNDLIIAGQTFEQQGDKYYVEAIQKYFQAKSLNYNNQLVNNEILRLQVKINAFVQEAKLKAQYLIGVDNPNALNLWINPALRMKPNDIELKELYNKAKK